MPFLRPRVVQIESAYVLTADFLAVLDIEDHAVRILYRKPVRVGILPERPSLRRRPVLSEPSPDCLINLDYSEELSRFT